MKLSPRQIKGVKWLLAFFAFCIIAVVVIVYLAVFHFKEIVRIGIYEETNGRYSFEASKIDLSILNKTIQVKDIAIVCNDTVHAEKHYALHIPEIYLSIGSMTDLIFSKKIEIDSLAITLPDIATHVHKNAEHEPVSLDVSDVFDGVHKLTNQLQVRTMHIKSGAYKFSNVSTGVALEANDLNLYVKNFGGDISGKKIFGAEDFDISMNKQHWKLPDGIKEISFKRFHFSGKNQFFEVDSCTFLVKPTETKNGILLTADKFFFNSTQLQDIYLKDELHLDTLLCLNPVLKVLPALNPSKDSVKTVSSALHGIFNKMSFGYIDVTGGQFILNNTIQDSAENSSSIKTDLKIYNLTTDNDNKPHLNADSIKLKLNSLNLMTKDSMYQLSINEFAVNNNDVVLLHTKFGPTVYNHTGSGITFTTPSLRIKNWGLEDLVEKRISGTLAELEQPFISVIAKNKVKKLPDSSITVEGEGMTNFYKALHNLNELIVVDSFKIINGTVVYKAPQKGSTIEMKKMNAVILLNNLLKSDSLIDIKRSMPDLRFGQVTARTPKVQLQLGNYSFDGSRRHNYARDFHLQLSNKTVLSGSELYWEILDWDLLANKNIIQIEYLQIGKLIVNSSHTKQPVKTKVAKDLPVINVGRIDIGRLSVDKKGSRNNSFSLQGQDICTDNIHSKKQFLTWSNLQGKFNGIGLESNSLTARLKEMMFYNGDYSTINGAVAEIHDGKGSTDIKAPLLQLNATISSTDFSHINIDHFHLHEPQISIYKNLVDPVKKKENKKPFTVPLNLTAGTFSVTNASLSYTAEKAKDTMQASAKINVQINGLKTSKQNDQPISYKKTVFTIDSLHFLQGTTAVEMPHNEIILTNGKTSKSANGKMGLQTGALINWQNTNIQIHSSDSTGVAVENISGFFHDLSLSLKPEEKIQLQSLLDHTNISEGKINYRGKKPMCRPAQ